MGRTATFPLVALLVALAACSTATPPATAPASTEGISRPDEIQSGPGILSGESGSFEIKL